MLALREVCNEIERMLQTENDKRCAGWRALCREKRAQKKRETQAA
jgi:hypothetical protein